MPTVADCLRQHGGEFLKQHGHSHRPFAVDVQRPLPTPTPQSREVKA